MWTRPSTPLPPTDAERPQNRLRSGDIPTSLSKMRCIEEAPDVTSVPSRFTAAKALSAA